MNGYAIWYGLLALVLVVGLGIQLIPKPGSGFEHYIGANTTRLGNNCTCTFMGGWDYHSFFGDVKIDNVSLGHIPERTVVYEGSCKNITLEAYERSVRTYVVIYRYTNQV